MPIIWGLAHDYTGLCPLLAFWLELVTENIHNKVSGVWIGWMQKAYQCIYGGDKYHFQKMFNARQIRSFYFNFHEAVWLGGVVFHQQFIDVVKLMKIGSE